MTAEEDVYTRGKLLCKYAEIASECMRLQAFHAAQVRSSSQLVRPSLCSFCPA